MNPPPYPPRKGGIESETIARDGTRLEVCPQYGTFSPWLVEAIREMGEAERLRSDRPGNMPYQRIVVSTEVIWPRESEEE